MIGAIRYYALRMWAGRYWPKLGSSALIVPIGVTLARSTIVRSTGSTTVRYTRSAQDRTVDA